jgi:hypothetical protein
VPPAGATVPPSLLAKSTRASNLPACCALAPAASAAQCSCHAGCRRDPLEGRKGTLEIVFAKAGPGIRFNEHMDGDGETVFRHACTLGLEGIVSKRKDSTYRSGRSLDWLKIKNADAPAVKREAEEDWGRDKWR